MTVFLPFPVGQKYSSIMGFSPVVEREGRGL